MLYIQCIVNETCIEKVWRVNDSPPNEFVDESEDMLNTLSITADGDELTYIIDNFKNLPYTKQKGRACVWKGELARFIFDNL